MVRAAMLRKRANELFSGNAVGFGIDAIVSKAETVRLVERYPDVAERISLAVSPCRLPSTVESPE
jgi:hypothetical protein